MMKRMKKLISLFLILFSLNMLFAEKIRFSANNMTGKSGDSNTTTTLSGNGYIKTESMEIQAEYIELSGEDYRYITSSGSVKGKNLDANMDFSCDSLEYDRETKVAKLKGNVELIDNDNDVKANAQVISYDQEADIAILQIQINLTQKDNVCSGSYAIYYKKDQLLELSGNAQIRQKDDTFRAQHITLNMDTQDITLGGNVKGTVTDSKTKESEDSSGIEEKEELEEKEINEPDKIEAGNESSDGENDGRTESDSETDTSSDDRKSE